MVMHLLKCLWFITASFDINITATYLPGKHNNAADMPSRDQGKEFLSTHPKPPKCLLPYLSPTKASLSANARLYITIIPPPLHRHTIADPAASSINTDLQLLGRALASPTIGGQQ